MKIELHHHIQADPEWKIAIIRSQYYKEEMEALTESAKNALRDSGVPEAQIVVYEAAGSFEIPLIGKAILEAGKADALIGLGIIVEGETHHAELLARETARGIMDVQLAFDTPFAFEILYVRSLVDAQKRLDKGEEAAAAVLQSLTVLKGLKR